MRNLGGFNLKSTVFTSIALVTCGLLSGCNESGPAGDGDDFSTVHGLRVAGYDTAKGIVTLTWDRSGNPDLSTYLVYRDPKDAISQSTTPLNKTRFKDTLYRDTLFLGQDDTASLPKEVEYRVALQESGGEPGKSNTVLAFTAPPPSSVKTRIRLSILGDAHDSASIYDTVRIVAEFDNRMRRHSRIDWHSSNNGSLLQSRAVSSHSGRDTLLLVANEQIDFRIACTLVDEGGASWTEPTVVHFVWDKPVPFFEEDETISLFPGDSVFLTGGAYDRFGRIVKWEWSTGPDGGYVQSADGRARFLLPDNGKQTFSYWLRVTDDDGLIDSCVATVIKTSHKKREPPPIGFTPIAMAALAGKVYALGSPRQDVFAFDPVKNTWTKMAARLASRDDFGTVVFGGRLYVIGGLGNGLPDNAVEAYDPATDSWEMLQGMNKPRRTHNIIATETGIIAIGDESQGKYTAMSENTAEAYDPGSNQWRLFQIPTGTAKAKILPAGGGIWKISQKIGAGLVMNRISESMDSVGPEVSLNMIVCHDLSLQDFHSSGEIIYDVEQKCDRDSDPRYYAINVRNGVQVDLGFVGRDINHAQLTGYPGHRPTVKLDKSLFLPVYEIVYGAEMHFLEIRLP